MMALEGGGKLDSDIALGSALGDGLDFQPYRSYSLSTVTRFFTRAHLPGTLVASFSYGSLRA
jgi:hypothetical protein